MDINHKLDLIQQIHREQEENERNIYRNYDRGYGYRSYGYRNYTRNQQIEESMQGSWLASFRLRLLLAVLLFICFFIMEKQEIKYGEIGCSEIVEYIDSNITMNDLLALF